MCKGRQRSHTLKVEGSAAPAYARWAHSTDGLTTLKCTLLLCCPGPIPGTRTTGGAIAAVAARMLWATVSIDMHECSISRQTKSMPASASTSVTSGDPIQFHEPISGRPACSASAILCRSVSQRLVLITNLAAHGAPRLGAAHDEYNG